MDAAGKQRQQSSTTQLDLELICIKASRAALREFKRMGQQPLIDAAEAKIILLAAETQFAANGIVSRTVLQTPSARTVLFGFAAGQELSEHTSTQHALIQILSGQCEFFLDGKPHTLKAGALLYMPPDMPHAVTATEQFSMLLTLFKRAEDAVKAKRAFSISAP